MTRYYGCCDHCLHDAQHWRPRRVPARRAVTTGQRAIEGKIVTVTPDMILRQAIEEEAQ